MAKSKNRKDHKKRVQARNLRLKQEKKRVMEQLEMLRKIEFLKQKESEKEHEGEIVPPGPREDEN